MKDLFDPTAFLTQETFKKYIGKTIEDIRFYQCYDEYPGDTSISGTDVFIKFTDGDQCLLGRIDFMMEGN